MQNGFIYFIQAKSGPIKIGFTEDPRKRFNILAVGHYEILDLLGVIPGTSEDEKSIHRAVEESRIRGEWFNPTEAVLAFVAKSVPAPLMPAPRSQWVALPYEREHIERAVATADSITKAARMLGCSRRTLQNRMRDLGLPLGRPGRRHKVLEGG